MNQQRHEFTIAGAKVTLTERSYTGRTREYTAAPRLYVSVENDAETVIGNLMNRTRRPYNVYKTLIHGTTLGKHLDLSKLSWSQHAGCTCNCSPGFILNNQRVMIDSMTFTYFDVWVTLNAGAPTVNEAKPAREFASV